MIVTVDGLRYGQLVRSIAGRDENHYYLILDMVGEKFISVVDGVKHPIARPKKKNLKHVKIIMMIAKEIEKSILDGELVTDSQIISVIKNMKNELEEGDRFSG
jgi:large subunit ribosomal protein L14e